MDKIDADLLSFFTQTMEEAKSLVDKKYSDYGNRPLMAFKDFGCLVRSTDKINRLQNLYNKDVNGKHDGEVGEKIDETWIDLANYAIWAIAIRKYLRCAD